MSQEIRFSNRRGASAWTPSPS